MVRNSKELFESFGFDTQPVLIGLILFQVNYIPWTVVTMVWYITVVKGPSHLRHLAIIFFTNSRRIMQPIWFILNSIIVVSIPIIWTSNNKWSYSWIEYNLCFLQHTVIPLQRIVSFVLNLVSRAFEFQVKFLCMDVDKFRRSLYASRLYRCHLYFHLRNIINLLLTNYILFSIIEGWWFC